MLVEENLKWIKVKTVAVPKHQTQRRIEGVEVMICVFLILVSDESEWLKWQLYDYRKSPWVPTEEKTESVQKPVEMLWLRDTETWLLSSN